MKRRKPDPKPAYPEAFAGWRQALAPERVITGGDRLELANRATHAADRRLLGILEPEDREEVVACLGVARRFGVPLYPVSGGRNWGYGSRLPPRDGSVLLSLHRMDRILEHDEELAYVTVEPGVSFRRLADFLKQRGSRLLPPGTGASPQASPVGCVLERGIGKGPYEDLGAHACGYEIVLPSGRIVRTGIAGLPRASAAAVQAEGPGPSLRGLFDQSNLGVVTRMTLWLAPAPEWRQRMFLEIRDRDLPADLIEALRDRLQRGGTALQAEIGNDYRFLSLIGQFPFDELEGSAVAPRGWVREHIRPVIDARWIGGVTLWAESAAELEARREALLSSLGDRVDGIRVEEPVPGRGLEDLSDDGVKSCYWRKRRPAPADPHLDRDRCGAIWLTPVLPMRGEVVVAVVGWLGKTMAEHGFEPMIGLRFFHGRSVRVVSGLVYDREVPGMDERAERCHRALRDGLYRRGHYPYRLGIGDMGSLPAYRDASREVLRSLKELLDPEGILAPGRYLP